LQNDIYGDDLLAGAPSEPQNEAQTTIGTDISQMSIDELRTALLEWQTTFQEQRQEGGILSGITGTIQPSTILTELRRAISSEQQARAESAALRQRLAGAAAEAAARVQEDVLLRKELQATRTAADPSVVALRQFFLEPVVNKEFKRLSKVAADATQDAAKYKNDVLLIHEMAKNPNSGTHVLAEQIRNLEEKCRALQQLNEEEERAKLTRALAMARSQLEEMKSSYGELEDHTHSLEDELEVLQREFVNTERRLIAATSGGERGGDRGERGGGGGGERAPYHAHQQQQGGWNRGPPMQHQPPPPPQFYNRGPDRGPPGPQQQERMGGAGGGGSGKRPRDY
jgi:hypothetical protein